MSQLELLSRHFDEHVCRGFYDLFVWLISLKICESNEIHDLPVHQICSFVSVM